MFKKSDIKSLPIDLIPETVKNHTEAIVAERLTALRAGIEAANNRKVALFAKDSASYVDSEAGSDGIEEHIREAIGLVDPSSVELDDTALAECRDEATKSVVTSFLETYSVGESYTWVLPQMRARFGEWEAVKIGDRYCGLATLKANCDNDFDRGLWYIAMRPRSGLIVGQGVRLYQIPEFNNLVPLILAAFRLFQNIPYSAWSRETLGYVVDRDLCEGMLSSVPVADSSMWLDIRNKGLVVMSGNKAGTSRDPKTTPQLYGLKDYKAIDLSTMSKYALIMKTQIWCAHPSNRGPYMVLDPENWDTMPEPIVSSDVLVKPKQFFTPTDAKPQKKLGLFPW